MTEKSPANVKMSVRVDDKRALDEMQEELGMKQHILLGRIVTWLAGLEFDVLREIVQRKPSLPPATLHELAGLDAKLRGACPEPTSAGRETAETKLDPVLAGRRGTRKKGSLPLRRRSASG